MKDIYYFGVASTDKESLRRFVDDWNNTPSKSENHVILEIMEYREDMLWAYMAAYTNKFEANFAAWLLRIAYKIFRWWERHHQNNEES